MGSKSARVSGASGLVGKSLAQELCRSEMNTAVKIFVRDATGRENNLKIMEFVTDFRSVNRTDINHILY